METKRDTGTSKQTHRQKQATRSGLFYFEKLFQEHQQQYLYIKILISASTDEMKWTRKNVRLFISII